ncbi:MAG: glycosyltransferase family 4 protein [Bacteroidetes bacterium]|nr:glycosyltransferase family 4 protein [Bacteroidota bacterium]
MPDKPLKIAYLSSNDPTNKKVWSGTHYSIYSSLKKLPADVTILGPYEPKLATMIGKVVTGLSQLIFKKRYNYRHSYLLAKAYGNYFNKKLNSAHYDVIIAPAATCELAFIKTTIPIIYISDSTINLSLNYHKALTGLMTFSERETRRIERLALSHCSKLIVSSEWAAKSLIEDYRFPNTKVEVLPFGANMELLPDKKDIENKDTADSCKLLFIGVYWESKGGDIAYNCFLELLKMGVNAELTICGCTPPENITHPKLKVIPFIDKNSNDGMQQLYSVFMNHDFLILPTRFDCTPIVICEASAFGLPSIVADTGGVAGHLTVAKNGYLVAYEDTGLSYATIIAAVFNDKEKFNQLKKSSREEFDKTLNWDAYREGLRRIISSIIQTS